MIDSAIPCLGIDKIRIIRIRQQAVDALAFAALEAVVFDDLPVFQYGNITGIADRIDLSIRTKTQVVQEVINESEVFHIGYFHLFVDDKQSFRGSDVDLAVFIFKDRTHRQRLETIACIPAQIIVLVLQYDTAVIGTDPQSPFMVDMETLDAVDADLRADAFKAASVVADQSAIGADPDEAFFGLYDIVGFRSRKAVAVII